SASLVISMLALMVALGGTSYAAFGVPKNSVGTKQLKNNAVTTSKIANGAVTGAKVNLSTLGTVPSATTAGTADNALALGGAPSSAFLRGTITVVATGPSISPGGFALQRADCPPAYQAVGGGVDPDDILNEVVTLSTPIINGSARLIVPDGQNPAATGWAAAVRNNDIGPRSFKVAAVCAPTG
ncbi:MAG TPA: hypothetical protein VIX82_08550, partial [Solirubrobacteraceae bacterium]